LNSDRGTGTLSAAIGLTVAMTLLLATVLVLARLHRTTLASVVAAESAHDVAEAGPDDGMARTRAEARIVSVLGDDVEVIWAADEGSVRLVVVVPSPPVPGLPATIRRGATARWEHLR
jgi:hypothetical protein